jgi:hypothetical protein
MPRSTRTDSQPHTHSPRSGARPDSALDVDQPTGIYEPRDSAQRVLCGMSARLSKLMGWTQTEPFGPRPVLPDR